jgi:RecA/RadA recombinase
MSPVDTSKRAEIISQIESEYEGSVLRGDELHNPARIPFENLELNHLTGGGIPIGRWTRMYGGWCLAPGTYVLKRDFSWVPVGDIREGDELIGFEEFAANPGPGKQRVFEPSIVEANPMKKLPTRRIVNDKGVETWASNDHLWLCSNKHNGATEWKRSVDLVPGDKILWFGNPWFDYPPKPDICGYLAGLFDGEGWVDRSRAAFAQLDGPVFRQGIDYLEQLGFKVAIGDEHPSVKATKYGRPVKRARIGGTVSEMMRFLDLIPSLRMRENAGDWWIGKGIVSKGRHSEPGSCYATVVVNEDRGEENLCCIQTSSKTLIANGMYSHNSSTKTRTCYAIIAEAQRMGMDCVYYNVEKQFDDDAASRAGILTEDLTVIEGTQIEAIGEKMEALLGVAHLHVVDSCSGAVSMAELAAEVTDNFVGIKARTWGKVLARAHERMDPKENTCILIDQMRMTFGGKMRQATEEPPGGRYMNFLSSLNLNFKKGKWIYYDKYGELSEKGKSAKTLSGSDEPEGRVIKVRNEKSRIGRPDQSASLYFDLNRYDFDVEWEYVKALKYLGWAKQSGSWWEVSTDAAEEKVQGDHGLRELLAEYPEIMEECLDAVMKLNKIPDDEDIEE